MTPERAVLVFDGDCGFCTTCVNIMQRRIKRLPEAVPYQFADLASLGLTEQQCTDAVQWVGANGSHAAGEQAVARVLIDAGSGWAALGRAMDLPGVRSLSGLAYRWVARHRHRLPGGTPACALPRHDDVGRRPS